MFFAHKIKGIHRGDKVLEIGPGNSPHPRSDVLLELAIDDLEEAVAQRGGGGALVTSKPLVFYDGSRFPFADGEFDYVICSHVLEHVPDVASFVAEVFRVARRGYFEYPTIYYDYLYNFSCHLNFLRLKGGALFHMRKTDTALGEFAPVQKLFFNALQRGNAGPVNELKDFMFEGFEWDAQFSVMKAQSLSDLVAADLEYLPRPSWLERKLFAVLNRVSHGCRR